MKLLFVEGDRGLVANYNGKFCFPDRNSSIKEVGLYDCEVTNDKGNYYFVKGNKINTCVPTQEFVNNLFVRAYIAEDYFTSIEAFHIKEVGTSIVVILTKATSTEFGYFNGVDFEPVFTLARVEGFPRYANLRNLERQYNIRLMKNWDLFDTYFDTALFEVFDEITDDNMYCIISKAYCNLDYYSSVNVSEIKIVSNKYIVIDELLTYTNSVISRVWAYNKNYGVVQLDTGMIENKLKKPARKVELSDLYNWFSENCVGRKGMRTEKIKGTPLLKKKIDVFNTCIEVIFYDGILYSEDCKYEYDSIVKKSFEELLSFRRKVGKNISKSNISEISKLSPKNILNLC